MLTATTGGSRQPAVAPSSPRSPREDFDETESRSWIGGALESAIYGILIVPLAIVVCAVVAFAIVPLHSDSRCDDSYE
ncbi:hypothetical protein XH79_37965 [Bradyrhizobium sp. CCBAU 45389]|nr:hypothetical protein [Bradyrhizobium sp. CCBAU 45389]